MNKLDTHWQTAMLSDVVDYYAKDFKPRPNERIIAVEHFIDHVKGHVIFRITTEPVVNIHEMKT